jgi:hypothetical protein
MNPSIKEIVVQTYRISLLRVIRRGHHITELKTMISKIIFTQIIKAARVHSRFLVGFVLFDV